MTKAIHTTTLQDLIDRSGIEAEEWALTDLETEVSIFADGSVQAAGRGEALQLNSGNAPCMARVRDAYAIEARIAYEKSRGIVTPTNIAIAARLMTREEAQESEALKTAWRQAYEAAEAREAEGGPPTYKDERCIEISREIDALLERHIEASLRRSLTRPLSLV